MEVQEVIQQALQIVGLLSTIAVFTPTPKDNLVLKALHAVLTYGAMNWGKAKNKDG